MKKNLLIATLFTTLLITSCKKDNPDTMPEDITVQDTVQVTKEVDSVVTPNQGTTQVIETGVPDACHELLIKMLETSKQYQKDIKGVEAAVKKNGGKGIGITIEFLDNEYNIPTQNKIFRLEVFENHPDRIIKLNTYVFSPDTKKLYKKDFILDEVSQIDFNQKKLPEIKLYCK